MNRQDQTRRLRGRQAARVEAKVMERPSEDVLTVQRIGATLLVLGAIALTIAALIDFLL